MTIKAGVVGASGYTGEVLLKLLLDHPQVDLVYAGSRQWEGKPVSQAMPVLSPLGVDLKFANLSPEQLSQEKLDVVFLALPHGVAAEFAIPLATAGIRVIDLSADFRLHDANLYQVYYKQPHPAPDWLVRTPYLLPEWNGDLLRTIGDHSLIAAPGCYPTSIILPLAPLLEDGLVERKGIVINSYSGVSGAGRKLADDFLFVDRFESMKAYGITGHRHISEIEEQLTQAAGEPVLVQFHPHLAPVRRGISTTISIPAKVADIEAVYQSWKAYYQKQPFVHLLPSGSHPDTAHYVGSNQVGFSAVLDSRTGNFVITSALDNLMKGAAGQAVQIMNLWFDLPQTIGLAGKSLSGASQT